MKLYCYCCGAEIGGTFALVTMSPASVDRAFIVLPDHVENIDCGVSLLVTKQ